MWNKLLGKSVPTLVARYGEMKDIRNDVMHSHNIDWSRYQKGLQLYTDVNKEIDNAIKDIVSNVEQTDTQLRLGDLIDAYTNVDLFENTTLQSNIGKMVAISEMAQSALSVTLRSDDVVRDLLSQLNTITTTIQLSKEIEDKITSLEDQLQPVANECAEVIKRMRNL